MLLIRNDTNIAKYKDLAIKIVFMKDLRKIIHVGIKIYRDRYKYY